jgi:hypothetical protein
VIERQRIVLADSKIKGSEQPYHAAEGLQLNKAEALLRRYQNSSRRLARQSLRSLLHRLQNNSDRVVGCGLLHSSGKLPGSLSAILASHALIHTADGVFFRDAIVHACERHGLPLTGVRERELYEHAATALHVPVVQLRSRIANLGRNLGPPWREDQKLAALVAWVALATKSRARKINL